MTQRFVYDSLRLFVSFLPFFCLLVGVATAADMLIKRGHRSRQQATAELVKALHLVAESLRRDKPTPGADRKNPHICDPHLELEPPEHA